MIRKGIGMPMKSLQPARMNLYGFPDESDRFGGVFEMNGIDSIRIILIYFRMECN